MRHAFNVLNIKETSPRFKDYLERCKDKKEKNEEARRKKAEQKLIIWTEENIAFRSIVEAAEFLNVTRQTVSQHVKLNESLADKIHFKKGINDGDMPRLWETLNDDEKQILKKKVVQYMKNEHHKSNKQCLKQIKALEEKLANIKMIKNYEEQIKMLQLKIENNKVAKRLKAQIEELKKCLQ